MGGDYNSGLHACGLACLLREAEEALSGVSRSLAYVFLQKPRWLSIEHLWHPK